jgi:phosphatidate cytidylyltransferase
MAGGDEPRKPSEGASGDLFEDLDQFFASIDESEWPEGVEPEDAAPPEAGAQPRRGGRRAADRPSDQEAGGEEGPGEAEAETETPPVEVEDSEYEDYRFEPSSERDGTGESGAEPPAAIEPGTQEMTGEDWARLRDVLGEEEEEEVEAFTFEEVPTELSPEESLLGYARPEDAEPDEDQVLPGYGDVEQPDEADMVPTASEPDQPEDVEPGELTLEDLKKAPPQYRDLPGLEGEGGEAPGGGARQPPPPLPDIETGEPTLAEVEAAADQLAGEFQTPGGVEEDLLGELGAAEAPAPPRTVRVGEPESMMGPAWEDPTATTVSAERAPAPGGGRNIPAAVITGALLAVAALIFVLVSKAAFAILAGVVVLFGLLELYATMQRREYQPATLLGLVMGGFIMAAAYLKGEQAMLFFLALSVLLSLLWYMAAPPKARTGLVGNIGATLLGVTYAPFLAGYVLLILVIPEIGRSLMLAVLGLTFLYDIAAFAGGSFFGARPLAPSISPRKSWEGALVGSALTLVFAIAIVPNIDPMSLARSVGLALVVAVFAPLGDLAESVIKRDLGVKDMGTILPGHGGILDRIDSALFVAPAAYYFFRLIFI